MRGSLTELTTKRCLAAVLSLLQVVDLLAHGHGGCYNRLGGERETEGGFEQDQGRCVIQPASRRRLLFTLFKGRYLRISLITTPFISVY